MIKRPRFEGKVNPDTHCVSCGHVWDTHHEKEDDYDTKCKECFCHSDPEHFWYVCDKCHNSDDCWTICEHCGASMCEDCEYISDNRTSEGAEDATDMWWICQVCGKDYDHIDVSNPKPYVEGGIYEMA